MRKNWIVRLFYRRDERPHVSISSIPCCSRYNSRGRVETSANGFVPFCGIYLPDRRTRSCIPTWLSLYQVLLGRIHTSTHERLYWTLETRPLLFKCLFNYPLLIAWKCRHHMYWCGLSNGICCPTGIHPPTFSLFTGRVAICEALFL